MNLSITFTLETEESGRYKKVTVGLNKSQWMDHLSAETKKVADVERWPLVEVRLSYILLLYAYSSTCSLIGCFLVITEHRVMGS